MAKHIGLFVLALSTCLITLAALSLVVYHIEVRCFSTEGGASSHICPTSKYADLCPGAYTIVIIGTSTTEDDTEFSMRCPWKRPTAVLGLIGFSLAQIFLGVFVLVLKGKGLKTLLAGLAGLIVLILLTCLGLMIRDLKKGFDFWNDELKGAFTSYYATFTPGSYIANALLLVIGVGLISTIAFKGASLNSQNQATNREVVVSPTTEPSQMKNLNELTFVRINN